jgi:hypothetical protein
MIKHRSRSSAGPVPDTHHQGPAANNSLLSSGGCGSIGGCGSSRRSSSAQRQQLQQAVGGSSGGSSGSSGGGYSDRVLPLEVDTEDDAWACQWAWQVTLPCGLQHFRRHSQLLYQLASYVPHGPFGPKLA